MKKYEVHRDTELNSTPFGNFMKISWPSVLYHIYKLEVCLELHSKVRWRDSQRWALFSYSEQQDLWVRKLQELFKNILCLNFYMQSYKTLIKISNKITCIKKSRKCMMKTKQNEICTLIRRIICSIWQMKKIYATWN